MSEFGYPKTKRLLKEDDFKPVFGSPVYKAHQNHLMAFAGNNQLDYARLGLAITKKKVPTAVQRNRIKRLIREQFRHSYAHLPHLDLVFIIKKSPKELSNQQLNKEISAILDKIIYKFGNTSRL